MKVAATTMVGLAVPARAAGALARRLARRSGVWYARDAMDLQHGRARIDAWRASISQKNG